MTTRETLRQWMEQLSEEDLEELARLLTERGTTVPAQRAQRRPEPAWIEAGDYPALAAIWDNDDDSIFDEL